MLSSFSWSCSTNSSWSLSELAGSDAILACTVSRASSFSLSLFCVSSNFSSSCDTMPLCVASAASRRDALIACSACALSNALIVSLNVVSVIWSFSLRCSTVPLFSASAVAGRDVLSAFSLSIASGILWIL